MTKAGNRSAPNSGAKKRDGRLAPEVRLFMIRELAHYRTPQEVATEVKDLFGLEVSRQAVHFWDPTRAAGPYPAKRWTDVFNTYRKQFTESVHDQPLAHQAYRLAVLHRQVVRAERSGNSRLVLELLKQAAEEMGGMFVRPTASGEQQPAVVNLNLGFGARAPAVVPEENSGIGSGAHDTASHGTLAVAQLVPAGGSRGRVRPARRPTTYQNKLA